jgi:sec-independent protein translocase protein TatB|tara:strand:- start:1638 stop:1895 length:258 start_codon:yes stop_codon:yes gene_type:complete
MPQIGWLELLIVVVIAILVIGPKDFPIVLRKLGTWTSTIKKYFSDVQSNINDITNLDEHINQDSNPKKNKSIEPIRSKSLDDKKK